MPDPTELLAAARLLANPNASGAAWPDDGRLRRAVSTAYYAVFHLVLRAAASRFAGPRDQASAAYAILYRGFSHAQMKSVCEAIQVPKLSPKLERTLRRTALSREMRDFAGAFAELQEERHRADVLALRLVGARA